MQNKNGFADSTSSRITIQTALQLADHASCVRKSSVFRVLKTCPLSLFVDAGEPASALAG
jgi:hypothetical protein